MRTALFILALSTSSLAQQGAEQDRSQTATEIVRGRNRERMRTDDPLVIVGLEQDDNGFRDRTPALANTDGNVALFDEDESYRRRIAMYEGGSSFDQAPAPVGFTVERARTTVTRKRDGGGAADVDGAGRGSNPWSWALATFFVLTLGALLLSRHFELVPHRSKDGHGRRGEKGRDRGATSLTALMSGTPKKGSSHKAPQAPPWAKRPHRPSPPPKAHDD